VEGARACPPEDIGGVYGYEALLQALIDSQDDQQAEMLDWKGVFKPEKFSAAQATRAMRRAMPAEDE